jgi:hypothetical protein
MQLNPVCWTGVEGLGKGGWENVGRCCRSVGRLVGQLVSRTDGAVTTSSSRLENSRRQQERLENSRWRDRKTRETPDDKWESSNGRHQKETPGEHPRQQQKTLQNKLTTTETREEREKERESTTDDKSSRFLRWNRAEDAAYELVFRLSS